MKEYIKTVLSAGIPFGIGMGLFFSLTYGIGIGAIAGGGAGLLFGLSLSSFVQFQRKKFRKNSSEITGGRDIIMDGPANHFKGIEGVGGWIYITSGELIFKSHAFNVQSHQIIIPLNQITEIRPVSTAGIIPNGLLVITNSGSSEKFVVNNRKGWIEGINNAVKALQPRV